MSKEKKHNIFDSMTFKMNDSGHRKEFGSGALRDRPIGKGRFDLISPFALKRLADIYEKGAIKYADRNWEKGMPISEFVDSAFRHIVQYMMGMNDEDHAGQAAWNLFCIIHYEETGMMPKWDNMPHYLG